MDAKSSSHPSAVATAADGLTVSTLVSNAGVQLNAIAYHPSFGWLITDCSDHVILSFPSTPSTPPLANAAGANDSKKEAAAAPQPASLRRFGGTGVSGITNGKLDAAMFFTPRGIAVSPSGDAVYIGEQHAIRGIDTAALTVRNVAGTRTAGYREFEPAAATATAASAAAASSVAVANAKTSGAERDDELGDATNSAAAVTTIAATGAVTAAAAVAAPVIRSLFFDPLSIACSSDGGWLYVADALNHVIRRVHVPSGATATVAGANAAGAMRKSHTDGATAAGANTAAAGGVHPSRSVSLSQPREIVFDPCTTTSVPDSVLFVAAADGLYRLQLFRSGEDMFPALVAACGGSSSGAGGGLDLGIPTDLLRIVSQYMHESESTMERVLDLRLRSTRIVPRASGEPVTAAGKAKSKSLTLPSGLAITPSGMLIVTCRTTHAIYAVDPSLAPSDRAAVLLAGSAAATAGSADGPALTAQFRSPRGLAIDPHAPAVVLVDSGNRAIRRLTLPAAWFVAPKFVCGGVEVRRPLCCYCCVL